MVAVAAQVVRKATEVREQEAQMAAEWVRTEPKVVLSGKEQTG
jgi:hypothetical protein